MSDLPLVSIITPSFNQGEFLEATICSVLDQDYPNIEYIVMDGGSTDDSVAILQRYTERITHWESQPDRGQAHAVNKGLQLARGSILGWLNSDDLLLPGTVSLVVKTFRDTPEIDVVYGRLERIDEEGRLVPTPILPKDRNDFSKERVLGECLVNQPGAFWQREIMEKAGFLDERLKYTLDYEYWIRLALAGTRFVRLPEVVARFRLSARSKTVSQATEMAQEQIQVLKETIEKYDLKRICGWDEREVETRANSTRARACLLAFNGELKRGNYRKAFDWLRVALRYDITSPFDRRWLDLGIASLQRRLGRRRLDRHDIINQKSAADRVEDKRSPPN
jgi:glycosyltransferase involved in cell wall biosynthesis